MINVLRSSHPFFFILSSCVLLLTFVAWNGQNSFSSIKGHPLSWLQFVPLYLQHILGVLLLFYSGFLINTIVNKSVLFSKNFYLPGLIYISLMLYLPDNGYLHPMAIANLFCILCFSNLIRIYRNESCKNHLFKACWWVILALICFRYDQKYKTVVVHVDYSVYTHSNFFFRRKKQYYLITKNIM